MVTSENSFPGERLGLPATGIGSVARIGRRIAALFIDYTAAVIIAGAFFGYDHFALPQEAGWRQLLPHLVFAVVQIVFIPTLGGSPGHRLVGLRLVRLGGGWTGFWRPLVRTALLLLIIPAVVWDPDQRGLHDKAAGTILIRA